MIFIFYFFIFHLFYCFLHHWWSVDEESKRWKEIKNKRNLDPEITFMRASTNNPARMWSQVIFIPVPPDLFYFVYRRWDRNKDWWAVVIETAPAINLRPEICSRGPRFLSYDRLIELSSLTFPSLRPNKKESSTGLVASFIPILTTLRPAQGSLLTYKWVFPFRIDFIIRIRWKPTNKKSLSHKRSLD